MEILRELGMMFVYYAVTAIFGCIGIALKNIYKNRENDDIKVKVAETCVKAVEQIYKDIHGEEKLNKALESASEMLAKKGIDFDVSEMTLLIEAAVAEFNKAYQSDEK